MLLVAMIIAFGYAGAAMAHPLGNNTINRQAALRITPDRLELRYLVDMAEIPTLSETQAADADHDGETTQKEWNAYAGRWVGEIAPYLRLEIGGQRLSLKAQDRHWALREGAAGLNILHLEARFSALLIGREQSAVLRYRDDHKPEQLGWKEIWISAQNGASITHTTVARTDRSHSLTDFTLPLGEAAPDELTAYAELVFPSAGVRDAQAPAGQTGVPATVLATPVPHSGVPRKVPSPSPTAPVSWTQQTWPFFKLGMHHIATGWDHLMFLLGLLLLRQPVARLVKVVTAFTIAHSATLALAASGLVTPPGAWVEPAIALTIAYVGLLSLVWQKSRHGIWLAFGFGLVHGFGFAGALAETLANQPPGRGNWLLSLASFNLGIEAFQITLICAVVPLMLFAMHFSWYGLAQRGASFVVLGTGLGWFFTRTVGTLL